MISKYSKKTKKFLAKRVFTDRVDPRKVFSDSIASISVKSQEIIVYYGKGGIGKTRLLKQLDSISHELYASYDRYSFYNIYLSFDAREINNEIGVMMTLRNKLHGDGGLFDYALISYWAKAKYTINEIKNKNVILSSNICKLLDDVIELGNESITIPAFIVNEAKDLIKDDLIKNESGNDIDEIGSLSENEILERLPYYLGLCFSFAAQNGNIHVFFFDAYENIKNVSQHRDWFMDFLASCETLRACIASRDMLRWSLENEGWSEVLNQHLLDNLSDEDCRWFLEQVPIQNEDIISNIVLHSGGVPLFLDMSVDLYEDDINNDRIPDFSKIKHGEKLIDRYMNYLDNESMIAIKILSVPDCFNTEFALYLIRESGIVFNRNQLKSLFQKSIVLLIDEETDMWKVDESVRSHLMSQMSYKEVSEIVSLMTCYIKKEGDAKAFLYFTSVLNTVIKIPKSIVEINEKIAELIDYYGNSGFWAELDKILESSVESEDDYLRAIAVMAKIIYIRRSGDLKEEETFISSHPIDEDLLGSYHFMLIYYKIQCRHLQGHYDEALERYRDLIEKMNLIKQTIPSHIYFTVCMKYADLLFLKGQFEKSLEITETLLNDSSVSVVDQIELMRIKGHILKFQLKYEEAGIVYKTALKLVQKKKLDAYLGKLMTNLAEASAFVNPSQSIEWFEKSREINEKCGNLIELGKAYSACSVANAYLVKQMAASGHSDQTEKYIYNALSCANKAMFLAKQSGYRSGEAFALVGLALAYKYGNNSEEHEAAVKKLEELLEELNVYKYLLELVI